MRFFSMISRNFFLVCFVLCTVPVITCATNVKDFGARGDGQADDTDAISAAIRGAKDGVVEFPRGSYRITRTIEIKLSVNGTLGLSGRGGSASIVMAGEGPAFRFIGSSEKASSIPSSVPPVTWQKERMPLIEALEIVGAHTKADGLELRNVMQPILRGLLVRNVRNGIHFTSRSRNVIIESCHVYNASGVGIYLDKTNIHQIIISDSHISYCLKAGVKVVGSQIRNFQITGNDIEYNRDPAGSGSADILIDCSQGGVVREGTISGNTIQALPSPGGANIRFAGLQGNYNKTGLWTITGNYISNQEVNIHLDHARGVNITGNTFLGGYDRHLMINDSRNVVISSNIFDHNEDYFIRPVALGGISVRKGENVIMNDNIIDGAEYGNEKLGGAIVVTDSREISVSGCHIKNPKFNGIQIENTVNMRVTDCIVSESAGSRRMLTGIMVNGSCPGTVIRDNSVGNGKNGNIVNNATGVLLEANIPVYVAQ